MESKTPVLVEVHAVVTTADLLLLANPEFFVEHRTGQIPQAVVEEGKRQGVSVFWDSIRTEVWRDLDKLEIHFEGYGWGYPNA